MGAGTAGRGAGDGRPAGSCRGTGPAAGRHRTGIVRAVRGTGPGRRHVRRTGGDRDPGEGHHDGDRAQRPRPRRERRVGDGQGDRPGRRAPVVALRPRTGHRRRGRARAGRPRVRRAHAVRRPVGRRRDRLFQNVLQHFRRGPRKVSPFRAGLLAVGPWHVCAGPAREWAGRLRRHRPREPNKRHKRVFLLLVTFFTYRINKNKNSKNYFVSSLLCLRVEGFWKTRVKRFSLIKIKPIHVYKT